MPLALELSPDTVAEKIPETEVVPVSLGVDERRIPLSFEVSGTPPPYNTSGYEQYVHAFRTIFERLGPAFVSVAEMPDADESWSAAYRDEPRAGDGIYRSIIEDTMRHGPIAKVVPVVTEAGRQEQDLQAELDWYASIGIERLLISPSSQELNGGEPDDYSLLNLLYLAKGMDDFAEVGVVMRLEQTPTGRDGHPAYKHIAGRLQIADFGVSLPLLHVEPYNDVMESMAAQGIHKPVTPGLLPFQTSQEAEAYASSTDIQLPWDVAEQATIAQLRFASPESHLRQVALDHTVQLAQSLIQEGAQSLHIYTRNHARLTQQLVDALDTAQN